MPFDGRYDALHVAFRLHFRKLGEHGGRDGDGEEGVGQRVPQTGVCEYRGAVDGKAIGGRVHDRYGRERDDHYEERRPADGKGVAKCGVVKVDAGAQTDAVSLERGELNGHLHEDAERVADGDDEERGVGVYGRDRGIHEEGCDDDDVVRHRSDRGPQIVAVCVQKARHDRRGAVEDELNGEVLEEKRRKRARRLVGVERLCIDDLGGEDHAEDRQHAEEDSYEREQVRRVGVARPGSRFLLDRDIDREKRRDEHAAHDELIEHVRQIVRNLIGAREERRAEREGHRPCSQEPGDAGEEYADAHERRRRADGRRLAFGLFADDGDIGRRRGGAYGVARLG